MIACRYSPSIGPDLLNAGADISTRNYKDRNAIDFAETAESTKRKLDV